MLLASSWHANEPKGQATGYCPELLEEAFSLVSYNWLTSSYTLRERHCQRSANPPSTPPPPPAQKLVTSLPTRPLIETNVCVTCVTNINAIHENHHSLSFSFPLFLGQWCHPLGQSEMLVLWMTWPWRRHGTESNRKRAKSQKFSLYPSTHGTSNLSNTRVALTCEA